MFEGKFVDQRYPILNKNCNIIYMVKETFVHKLIGPFDLALQKTNKK